mmetsp:Transcript_6361/g.13750  ORF Transcript_6361/g.13750 Transcript_6361/m.13750 type:complete len:337 (-) Transcript_6361:168-1178(-)
MAVVIVAVVAVVIMVIFLIVAVVVVGLFVVVVTVSVSVSAATFLRNGLNVHGGRIIEVMSVPLELDRNMLGEDNNPREPRCVDAVRRVVPSSHLQIEASAGRRDGPDSSSVRHDGAVALDESPPRLLQGVQGVFVRSRGGEEHQPHGGIGVGPVDLLHRPRVRGVVHGEHPGPLEGPVSVAVGVADQLAVRARGLVADLVGAGDLEVVQALLGGAGEGVVGTVVVHGAEREEEVAALVGGAVGHAALVQKGGVGLVAAAVGADGGGAGGGARGEEPLDLAVHAGLVVVVEPVLDLLGDVFFRAVVVVGLDDEVVLDAFSRRTVGGARSGLEFVERR